MEYQGIFESISNGYFDASKASFAYLKKNNIATKLILFPIAFISYCCMAVSAIFFRFFIVFDWLSAFVDSIRQGILNKLIRLQHNIPYSFVAFLINPLLIILLAPVFMAAALLPKISSRMPSLISDSMEQFSEGAFRQMNKITWGSANNLFVYVTNCRLILKPFAALVAIAISIPLLLTGAAFFIFIIFDIISGLFDRMRKELVSITYRLARSTQNSFTGFLIAPMLLLCLVPIITILLIIPKISSGIDSI